MYFFLHVIMTWTYKINCKFIMAQQHTCTKKKRLQFSLNIELPLGEESRLQSIKERLQTCKKKLGLSKKSSSTQNADLIETLLLAFEYDYLKSSNSISSISSTESPTSPTSFRISPLRSRDLNCPPTPGSFIPLSHYVLCTPPLSASTPRQDKPAAKTQDKSSQRYVPRTEQVTTPASKNDQIILCTEGSLQSLVSFFVKNQGKCTFCQQPFIASSTTFARQGHCATMTVECLCLDKLKWLTSPMMAGGSIVKYYVNMR